MESQIKQFKFFTQQELKASGVGFGVGFMATISVASMFPFSHGSANPPTFPKQITNNRASAKELQVSKPYPIGLTEQEIITFSPLTGLPLILTMASICIRQATHRSQIRSALRSIRSDAKSWEDADIKDMEQD
jgi:hypothetical protein